MVHGLLSTVRYIERQGARFNMPEPNESDRERRLTPEARRALAEAAARREAARARPAAQEIGGPAGPEPTRYGDWERKGIVSDF
jgi:hypothetical protein